jgi:hypothetical protein
VEGGRLPTKKKDPPNGGPALPASLLPVWKPHRRSTLSGSGRLAGRWPNLDVASRIATTPPGRHITAGSRYTFRSNSQSVKKDRSAFLVVSTLRALILRCSHRGAHENRISRLPAQRRRRPSVHPFRVARTPADPALDSLEIPFHEDCRSPNLESAGIYRFDCGRAELRCRPVL